MENRRKTIIINPSEGSVQPEDGPQLTNHGGCSDRFTQPHYKGKFHLFLTV
jgi:hypothetical protein